MPLQILCILPIQMGWRYSSVKDSMSFSYVSPCVRTEQDILIPTAVIKIPTGTALESLMHL